MDVDRLVCGVGINDVSYKTSKCSKINGKWIQIWRCPYHKTWVNILTRSYNPKEHLRHKSYSDCETCEEWHLFSNFKNWMEQQDWQGKDIDKDILVVGNKVYSPDTCVFVHSKVNSFILDRASARGEYMLGVCWSKAAGKMQAGVKNPFTGKREYLGLFTDELEAHLAWKRRKHELACMLADSDYVQDTRVAEALRQRYL